MRHQKTINMKRPRKQKFSWSFALKKILSHAELRRDRIGILICDTVQDLCQLGILIQDDGLVSALHRSL